jgi:hypothetical protein
MFCISDNVIPYEKENKLFYFILYRICAELEESANAEYQC